MQLNSRRRAFFKREERGRGGRVNFACEWAAFLVEREGEGAL